MGKTYIADKETLDKCYAILSADGIYGFIEHMDVLSPTARIEYIGQNKDFTPISLNKDTGAMTLNSWAGSAGGGILHQADGAGRSRKRCDCILRF